MKEEFSYEQNIDNERILGFFKSQKKMVDDTDHCVSFIIRTIDYVC